MALINDIKIIEIERKMWLDRYAYVFSDTGIWRYDFEYHNDKEINSSWKDDADYIDNVRSDFLNEAGKDGQKIHDSELFQRSADVLFIDEDERYYHQKGQRTIVDYHEMLPELIEKGLVIVVAS